MLDQPPIPTELAYLWHWYLDLRGSEALSFSEIRSWSELTGKMIQAWEVEVLRMLDLTYWNEING